MSIPVVLSIGAACGLLSAAGIYFDPRVPGKAFIVAAGTIRGAIVALLAAFTAGPDANWLLLAGYGALYGLVVGLIVVLSKGEAAMRHAVYILPASILSGAVSGALIRLLPL